MGEIQTTKVEYKITTSIEGTCPHCLKTIHIEKVEESSDDVPSQEFYEKCHKLFRRDDDAYSEYLHDNPTFINLSNLRETWRERVEKLPIRSLIKSEATYILSGECPYCDKRVNLRMPFTIIFHEPPKIEPEEERKIHTFENCPLCGKEIHITGGRFYTESECLDHASREFKKKLSESEQQKGG